MSDDVGFVCPHCTTKIKYTAGMTFGEVMSLRHDKEHLSHKVTRLRADLAAVTAERDRMREALRPFAAQLDHPGTIYEHDGVRIAVVNQDILDRLCLDARAALEGVTEPPR